VGLCRPEPAMTVARSVAEVLDEHVWASPGIVEGSG
jgi:hypothetical protein